MAAAHAFGHRVRAAAHVGRVELDELFALHLETFDTAIVRGRVDALRGLGAPGEARDGLAVGLVKVHTVGDVVRVPRRMPHTDVTLLGERGESGVKHQGSVFVRGKAQHDMRG